MDRLKNGAVPGLYWGVNLLAGCPMRLKEIQQFPHMAMKPL